MNTYQKIQLLRSLRIANKITTKEIAEQLGYAPSTVSGWEHGYRSIPEQAFATYKRIVCGKRTPRPRITTTKTRASTVSGLFAAATNVTGKLYRTTSGNLVMIVHPEDDAI